MSSKQLTFGASIISFEERSGLPISLTSRETDKNYILGAKQPFFKIVLSDDAGQRQEFTGLDASTAYIKETGDGALIYYNFLGLKNLHVKCRIKYDEYTDFDFGLEVRNETGLKIISVEYPIFLMPEVIEEEKNDWVLWHHCFFNGVLTHGFKNLMTGNSWLMQSGFAVPIQMCAFGTSHESLYYCTKDLGRHSKDMQPVWTGTNFKISSIYYYDEADHKKFVLPYTAGVSFLNSGEWYNAAEKYRDWAERQEWCAKKLWEKHDYAGWWLESPIVLSIKERGKRNKEIGQMPSPWCYPLEKGMDRINELAEKFDSKLNVQIFHWEKGGAFINGDHFPPLGGYDNIKRFFDQLHERGNYGGVYILPSKWCLRAETTGFDGSEFFDEHDAAGSVCCDEQLNPVRSLYDWEWRKRFAICAATPEGRDEIVNAFKVFSELGADYIQYDTFNGRLVGCWSKQHGHYPGPGRWQYETSLSIVKEIRELPNQFAMTVEAQPNECLIPFVDGFAERGIHPRSEKGWESVPLYQYIYHQYVQGFSGEECGPFNTPDNFFLVNAISIVTGDMLMINLGVTGRISIIAHETHEYDQTVESVYPAELIETYIKDLNRLRRDFAREFLVTGKMERPPVIQCDIGKIIEAEFHKIEIPAVLGSSWSSPEGHKGTILVNYTAKEQDIFVTLRYDAGSNGQLISTQNGLQTISVQKNGFAYKMKPYEALVIKNSI